MTIAGRLLKWIKKTAVAIITGKDIEKELKETVEIVNIIKKFIDSPIAVILVKLTKTQIDDLGREWLSNFLQAMQEKYEDLKSDEALREIAGKIAQKKTDLPLATASLLVEETYQVSKV